jgi:hypothetical protein
MWAANPGWRRLSIGHFRLACQGVPKTPLARSPKREKARGSTWSRDREKLRKNRLAGESACPTQPQILLRQCGTDASVCQSGGLVRIFSQLLRERCLRDARPKFKARVVRHGRLKAGCGQDCRQDCPPHQRRSSPTHSAKDILAKSMYYRLNTNHSLTAKFASAHTPIASAFARYLFTCSPPTSRRISARLPRIEIRPLPA